MPCRPQAGGDGVFRWDLIRNAEAFQIQFWAPDCGSSKRAPLPYPPSWGGFHTAFPPHWQAQSIPNSEGAGASAYQGGAQRTACAKSLEHGVNPNEIYSVIMFSLTKFKGGGD